MNDPLTYLWGPIACSEPVFGPSYDPSTQAAFLQLLSAGILQQAETATCITCPACDGNHVETIIALAYQVNGCRHAIPCPEHGRVLLSDEEIVSWSVSFSRLVEMLAAGLELNGQIREIEPRRLWRLGSTEWQARRRMVLFARGFETGSLGPRPPDVSRHRDAIVLVPHRNPSGFDWGDHVPTVVPLPSIATLVDGRIEIDVEALASDVYGAERRAEEDAEGKFSLQDLTLIINQQVKTIQRQELPDDILVGAYLREGSTRKAAEALSRESGREVTKDKVQRALQRFGGMAAVARGDDSDSVVRKVATQHRDRVGRRLHATPKASK